MSSPFVPPSYDYSIWSPHLDLPPLVYCVRSCLHVIACETTLFVFVSLHSQLMPLFFGFPCLLSFSPMPRVISYRQIPLSMSLVNPSTQSCLRVHIEMYRTFTYSSLCCYHHFWRRNGVATLNENKSH